MNNITKNAMLNRWHRMAEANVAGAYDIYRFLKGAIEFAGDTTVSDEWEDTPYCNNDFSDIVEPLLNGFKYQNQHGETGSFAVWHTHGVKCAEFSETAFIDLEEYIFKSRIGSYLYDGFPDIPTYREIWQNMNRPAVTPRKTRTRRGCKTA